MPGLLDAIPWLFAENAPAANAPTAAPVNYLPYILVLGLWGYFLLFRPQQQAEKRRREMISALKKNDKVLTNSGIFGTVVSVDNEQGRVGLRVDDDKGVKMFFSREAIAKVIDPAAEKKTEDAA